MTGSEVQVGSVLRSLPDAQAVWLWQRELCRRLGLDGRVVVSPQGLRGTLGGGLPALERYAAETREHHRLADVEFHRVPGPGRREAPLSVVLRAEAVEFGAAGRLQVGPAGLPGVRRLLPRRLGELLRTTDREVVLFDARNRDQTAVGRLRGAVLPDVSSARELREQLDGGRWDHLRERFVVTYCCCGARAELLAGLMTERGFGDVWPLAGGLVGASDVLSAGGLWQGSLYLLDGRVRVRFGAGESAGHCESCGSATDHWRECVAPLCRGWALLCNGCADFALCAAHRN